jgi:hypothetical protein
MKNHLTMKTIQTLLTVVVAGLVITSNQPTQAAPYSLVGPGGVGTYSSGTISPNQVILDNSPVGVGYGFDFSESGLKVDSLVLTLNMSGGFNSDMYGYLQHGGTLIELFNPASFSAGGASGSTLNLSLASGTGLSSLSTATAANLAGGSTYAAFGDLNGFVGAQPFGLWTLYFADQGAGDKMTLNGFSLDIAVVPEPTTWATMIFFGIGFAGFQTVRHIRNRRQ